MAAPSSETHSYTSGFNIYRQFRDRLKLMTHLFMQVGTDMPPSLVVLSLVTNSVATALTLMHALTPVPTGVRAAASSWKTRVISSTVHGWSFARRMVGWKASSHWVLGDRPSIQGSWLCFKHPVVRCQVLIYARLLFLLSPLLLPTFPSPCAVLVCI